MSSTFELAVVRPPVDAGLLRRVVKDAIDATGWSGGCSDVTVFAYQLTAHAAIVEHRAARSPLLGPRIQPLQDSVSPFPKHRPRIEPFYIELAGRLAPSGCRTLAVVTSDSVCQWAVYAIDREALAAFASRSLIECLSSFGRLPQSILQDGDLDPDGLDGAAIWLSSALNIDPPLLSMSKFHDWLMALWEGSTMDQWLRRIILHPVCLIRSGRILPAPEEVDATEVLGDEAHS